MTLWQFAALTVATFGALWGFWYLVREFRRWWNGPYQADERYWRDRLDADRRVIERRERW